MAIVFISHSAGQDETASTDLTAITEGLQQAGHDVLVDRTRLQAGDDWNSVIVNWMFVCDAAVVLFSQKALQSRYLTYEVSNLVGRFRREQQSLANGGPAPVRICPVALPDVDANDLKQSFFGAIHGDLLQVIKQPNTPETIVAEILKVIPDAVTGPTLLEEVQILIAAQLRRGSNDVLKLAARAAGLTFAPLIPQDEYASRLARHLLTCSIQQLFLAVQRLRAGSQVAVGDIVDLVTPSWVSPEAALGLQKMLRTQVDPTGHRCAIINAEVADFTPRMYLRRARNVLDDDAGLVVPLNPPDTVDAATAILNELRLALGEELRVDTDDAPPTVDAAIARAIDQEIDLARPVLVAVPRGTLPVADYFTLLDGLRNQPFLSKVTFVAACGSKLPAEVPDGDWHLTLRPELGEQQEETAHRKYRNIDAAPKRAKEARA